MMKESRWCDKDGRLETSAAFFLNKGARFGLPQLGSYKVTIRIRDYMERGARFCRPFSN